MLKSIHLPIRITKGFNIPRKFNPIISFAPFHECTSHWSNLLQINRDSVWITQPYWSNKTKSLQYVVLAISDVDFSVHVRNFLKCFGLLEIAEIFHSIVNLPGTQIFLNLVLLMNCNVLYTQYFNGAIYIIMLRFWVIYEVIIIIIY